MPWTEELPGGTFRGCWRDDAGRKRSRSGFTQKARALRFAGEQESLTRKGLAAYQGRSVTWGAWCEKWCTLRLVERTTSGSDDDRINRWLLPRWGNVPLARITHDEVQAWVGELAEDMAPASVHKVYGLLRSSLKAAVRSGQLAVTPCTDIELPVVPPSDERFLTRTEFDTVAHHLDEPYRTAAILLVGTGMRFGEMAGLHWHRVDLTGMTIDVQETWDGERIKSYPKGRRKRRVPLPGWVADAILAYPSTAKDCGLPHDRGSRCRSGLVIRAPRGGPLNARNMLRRHWAPAVARAGFDHARQHDLRHSTASWLIQDGASLTAVAALLGHSETTVTQRYAHLAGTHMDRVRAILENRPAANGAPYPPLDLETARSS